METVTRLQSHLEKAKQVMAHRKLFGPYVTQRNKIYLPIMTFVMVLLAGIACYSSSLHPPAEPVTANSHQTGNPQELSSMRIRKLGPIRAPELSGGKNWLNTDKPLSLSKLKGKVVLLDFWTYCCINCMHILPDLKKLETKYSKELVVIGVHSAKFDNEKDTENIRQAILRYEIHHPVVNDADFRIWQTYGVRAWPTLMLIDPEGYVANAYSGEGHYEEMDSDIGVLIEEARTKGILKSEPLNLALEHAKSIDMPLSFPGKILADEPGKRLFISDSNHNRIVVAKLDGTVTDVIGSGQIGQTNGDFAKSQFNHPQGLALDGDRLYVADNENHLLRRVNLKSKTVETVAGTGEQGFDRSALGPGKEVALSSPWDLQILGRALYIAMAGTHQIWKYELDKGMISRYVGSGRENCFDGDADSSALAQPSGLATDGQHLFVADSEVSSLRTIDTKASGRISTLAGSGDLFGFGDHDGIGETARFQHPLGVTFHKGLVYVADTYNHKIKVVNPEDRSVKTLAGKGKSGHNDGEPAAFFEPGGLSFVGDTLYVADTNNHAIRVIDLKTQRVSTLALKGLTPVSSPLPVAEEVFPNAETVTLPLQKVRANTAGELVLQVELPAGFHLNQMTTHRYRVNVESGQALSFKPGLTQQAARDLKFPVRIPFMAGAVGSTQIEVAVTFYYCRTDNSGVCQIKSVIWKIPVEVGTDGNAALKADFTVR